MIRRCRSSGEGGRPAGDSTSSEPLTKPTSLPRQAPATATPNHQTAKPLPQKPVTPRRYHYVQQPQPQNPFTVADGTAHKPKAMKTTGASGGADSGRVRPAKSKNKRGHNAGGNRHHATFAKHVPRDQWRLELCVMAAEGK
eukprot:scaffold391290_cov55-Attheya_sp.AAC.1